MRRDNDSDRTSPLKLSTCPFEARQQAMEEGMKERMSAAVDHARSRYHQRTLLEECVAFAAYNLTDAPSATLELLRKVGFFPWVEAERDFDQALKQAILSHYKSVYDHLRRALELVLVGAYLTSPMVTESEAVAWVRAEEETPMFSRALKRLLSQPRYKALDDATGWSKAIQDFYWSLCDVVHVRGMSASFNSVQPSWVSSGGTYVPAFFAESLDRSLDAFVNTVRHACTVLAVNNPILLVGLPIEEKFGFDPPASGFFNEAQAARLRSLVIEEVKEHFSDVTRCDPEVNSIREWVLNRPDVTDAEFEAQVAAFHKMFPQRD